MGTAVVSSAAAAIFGDNKNKGSIEQHVNSTTSQVRR